MCALARVQEHPHAGEVMMHELQTTHSITMSPVTAVAASGVPAVADDAAAARANDAGPMKHLVAKVDKVPM
jgi:hypothetical protein